MSRKRGQRQRRVQGHDPEARRVHRDEPPRQRGNQIGLGNDGQSEHEVRNGQRDPPRIASLCQSLVDEAMAIAGERDHQMLRLAIALQGRIVRERMSGAHRDDEVLLVEGACMEARRNVVGGNDRDVHRARLQIGEGGAPRALGGRFPRRGQQLTNADVDAGRRLRSPARSGGRNTAEAPSGAPIVNRRVDVAGSNGSAVEMTLRTRARTSAIGAASSVARAVGTTPFGVLRNSGSLSSRRSRPSPWLTAEGVRFSRSAARPTCRSSSTTSKRTSRLRSMRERSIIQHIA